MSAGAEPAIVRTAQSPWRRVTGDFFANPVAVFGAALLGLIILAAICARS